MPQDAQPASLYTLQPDIKFFNPSHRSNRETMHCWARYLFFAVVLVLGIGNMVTACGQKGDLYLVDESKKDEDPYQPGVPQGGVPQPQAQPAER